MSQELTRVPEPSLATITELVNLTLPQCPTPAIRRALQGNSTYVYTIQCRQQTFYLRILPEVDNTFAPEVIVHERLLAQGVPVPQIVYYTPVAPLVNQSVLITTAIPGQPLTNSASFAQKQAVLHQAGRCLAIVNSTPVAGFGWICRDASQLTTLKGEQSTLADLLLENFDQHLVRLQATVLKQEETAAIRSITRDNSSWLRTEQGVLAHGDFDPTHIFHNDGRFTGFIDFGEIRGADQWYDLGYFHFTQAGAQPELLPLLLAGYTTHTSLPANSLERISFAALLIGIRRLARFLDPQRQKPVHSTTISTDTAAIRQNLAQLRKG